MYLVVKCYAKEAKFELETVKSIPTAMSDEEFGLGRDDGDVFDYNFEVEDEEEEIITKKPKVTASKPATHTSSKVSENKPATIAAKRAEAAKGSDGSVVRILLSLYFLLIVFVFIIIEISEGRSN